MDRDPDNAIGVQQEAPPSSVADQDNETKAAQDSLKFFSDFEIRFAENLGNASFGVAQVVPSNRDLPVVRLSIEGKVFPGADVHDSIGIVVYVQLREEESWPRVGKDVFGTVLFCNKTYRARKYIQVNREAQRLALIFTFPYTIRKPTFFSLDLVIPTRKRSLQSGCADFAEVCTSTPCCSGLQCKSVTGFPGLSKCRYA